MKHVRQFKNRFLPNLSGTVTANVRSKQIANYFEVGILKTEIDKHQKIPFRSHRFNVNVG